MMQRELALTHRHSLNYQLRDLQINIQEFFRKKCKIIYVPVIEELQDLFNLPINLKSLVPQLKIHLQTLKDNNQKLLLSSSPSRLSTFINWLTSRANKISLEQKNILYTKQAEECALILTHHLNRITHNPFYLLLVSESSLKILNETKIVESEKKEAQTEQNEAKTEKKLPPLLPSSTYVLQELTRPLLFSREDESLVSKEGSPQLSKVPSDRPYHKISYSQGDGLPTAMENITHPRATYPLRRGNMIKHYSNTSDNLEGTQGAYADMVKAILQARHYIFIAGWLFEPQYHFPRKTSSSKTLGEILIDQAIAHPQLEIAILVWRQFVPSYEHRCALSYLKELAKKNGLKTVPANLQLRKVRRTGMCWSHHQKFMVVDTLITPTSSVREMMGFCGGADLAGGKFDTHEHPILDMKENAKVVSNVFRDGGIYRPAAPVFDHHTPRLPWRESSFQMKGPSTQDLLTEFVTRWCADDQGAMSAYSGSKDLGHRVLRTFLHIRKNNLFAAPLERSEEKGNQPIWDTQIVRSGQACVYAGPWRLNKPYEKSISKAYLQAIDQANRFIYLETQYLTDKQVAQAIVTRIIEQHNDGKPFHVFIMLPMLPNGDAGGKIFVEPIRYLQWKIMQEMMTQIETKTDEYWGQYLTFGFFGQWEHKREGYLQKFNDRNTKKPELITYAGHAAVYLHSKLMIVDDKFVINGSANLTERSLGGGYDTEIAGYHRPSAGHEEACVAETRAFRLTIWQPYFGRDCLAALGENGFAHPYLPKNIAIIQKQARSNLVKYMCGDVASSSETGHLLTWPFKLEKGCIGELEPGCEFLPDTLLAHMQQRSSIHRWFPSLESKPIALSIATGIRHKGYC